MGACSLCLWIEAEMKPEMVSVIVLLKKTAKAVGYADAVCVPLYARRTGASLFVVKDWK
jgi:hypothetical protein